MEIAGNVINKLREPISWSWTVSNVSDWLRDHLKLPQYVNTFKCNEIDGKKLILIDCSVLPSLNIINFEHMKFIAMNIRRLYGLPPDKSAGRRRRSVHDLYGQYYTYLAVTAQDHRRCRLQTGSITLFDFAQLTGLVSSPAKWTSGCHFDEQSVKRPNTLMARLPATEYLRGNPCVHKDSAIIRIRHPALITCEGWERFKQNNSYECDMPI